MTFEYISEDDDASVQGSDHEPAEETDDDTDPTAAPPRVTQSARVIRNFGEIRGGVVEIGGGGVWVDGRRIG